MKLSKTLGGDEYEAYISRQVMHYARRLCTEPGCIEVSKDLAYFALEHCLSFYDLASRVDYNASKILEAQGQRIIEQMSK